MNFKKNLVLILALSVFIAIFSGCSNPKTDLNSQNSTVSQNRIITDSINRQVEIPAKIDRVASSGALADIVLFSLCPNKMVGFGSKLPEMATGYIDSAYLSLPTLGQFYGKNASLNLEALVAVNPQVIIDVGKVKASMAADLDSFQAQTGIPIVFVESSLKTLPQMYTTLGDILGDTEQAAALSKYSQETLDLAKENSMKIPEGQRKNVYCGAGSDGLQATAAGSDHSEVIETIGANNVAQLGTVSTTSGNNQVSLEQIIIWNPDVILFHPGSIYYKIYSEPLWADISAVKASDVYEVPAGPYNFIDKPPSVNQLIGIKWLGDLLYPEVYNLDIYKEIKDFYKLFYHCDISDEQVKSLLQESI